MTTDRKSYRFDVILNVQSLKIDDGIIYIPQFPQVLSVSCFQWQFHRNLHHYGLWSPAEQKWASRAMSVGSAAIVNPFQ